MITAGDWLALGTAGIGVLGTLGGVGITQALANKRENQRWYQEQESDRQRLHREDHLRFHEDKKNTYAAFFGPMQAWRFQMFAQLNGESGGQAFRVDGFDDFASNMTVLIAQLQLIAPAAVWTKAMAAWAAGAAAAQKLALPEEWSSEAQADSVNAYSKRLDECLNSMRSDLGVGSGHEPMTTPPMPSDQPSA